MRRSAPRPARCGFVLDAAAARRAPTVSPGGRRRQPLERAAARRGTNASREARVVADRQRLAPAAEQHLLVRDEARQADGVDRHIPPISSAVAFAVRTERRASSRGAARRSRRRHELRRLRGEAHHQHRADREVRRDRSTAARARARASPTSRSVGSPSSRRRTATPASSARSTFATTASGVREVDHRLGARRASTSSWPAASSAGASTRRPCPPAAEQSDLHAAAAPASAGFSRPTRAARSAPRSARSRRQTAARARAARAASSATPSARPRRSRP